ncbi:MAG: hypothetical protein CME70_16570 [Halobacteriovorax sp.]|nr:hypothetical protein [Halobacteriovorax sp.]
MRTIIFILSITLFSYSSFAGLGENDEQFLPNEFTMKSYIKAHELVLEKRIKKYNKEGLNWLISGIKNKDAKDLIKTQSKRTRTKRLIPIRKRDQYYVLEVAQNRISFSAADLLLDRVYVNGKEFNLDKKETLPMFQNRLLSFIKKSNAKKTSFLNFLVPKAHAYNYDKTRVQELVVLNASGVISVTYDKPWFWEVGQYSVDLAHAFTEQLNLAYRECDKKTHEMSKYSSRRIGSDFQKILNSMKTRGKVDSTKVISSLLKKFSGKNKVDRETSSDSGKYKPLGGKCAKIDKNSPGLIQQMFPISAHAPVLTGSSYATWVRSSSDLGGEPDARYGVCDALQKTVSCLANLEVIQANNIKKQKNEAVRLTKDVNLDEGTVFDEVNGSRYTGK